MPQVTPEGTRKFLEDTALSVAEKLAIRTSINAEVLGGGEIETYEHFTATGNITSRINSADPASGSIVLTLPVASTVTGRSFVVKRAFGGANSLSVAAAENIDGYTTPFFMSFNNDSVTFFSDGTSYLATNYHRAAIATLSTAVPTTFALTAGFTKFDAWDASQFDSAGRLDANFTTDQITLLDFPGGLSADLYIGDYLLTLEFTNNKYVGVQFYINGGLFGQTIYVNALGAGKPVSLFLRELLFISGNGPIEVHLIGESPGTLTVTSSSLFIERLRG